MKIKDLFQMSIANLLRRKMRTVLTILGVVIGACSIILMLSLGIALNMNFEKQISEMQSLTIIEVSPDHYSDKGDDKSAKLDDKMIEKIYAIPGVQRVIPQESILVYLEMGKLRTSWAIELKPLAVEDAIALGYSVDRGRDFIDSDSQTIILGNEVTKQFIKKGQKQNYNIQQTAVDLNLGVDKIKININELDYETGRPLTTTQEEKSLTVQKVIPVTAVGIYPETSWETSYSAFVPRTLFEKIKKDYVKYQKALLGKSYNEETTYRSLKVKISDKDKVEYAQNQIKDLGLSAFSALDMLNEMKGISNMIQLILGGIGGISLLVAAIGIANTMMMSIYERTREIGIMKVIGAKVSDIKSLFLMEALMIGLIGGTIGVIISYGVSAFLNHFGAQFAQQLMGTAGLISVIPWWLSLSALGFSAIIGVLAGYIPAKRTTQLSALAAMNP